MIWTFDVEADNFLNEAKSIWVVCVRSLETGEEIAFRDPLVFSRWVTDVPRILIGHNVIDYDVPVLEKLWYINFDCIILDTMVLSYLHNPDRRGGHSLKSWGLRTKDDDFKIEFNDFSHYSQEMEDYCVQDVRLTERVYKFLAQHMGIRTPNTESDLQAEEAWSSLQYTTSREEVEVLRRTA